DQAVGGLRRGGGREAVERAAHAPLHAGGPGRHHRARRGQLPASPDRGLPERGAGSGRGEPGRSGRRGARGAGRGGGEGVGAGVAGSRRGGRAESRTPRGRRRRTRPTHGGATSSAITRAGSSARAGGSVSTSPSADSAKGTGSLLPTSVALRTPAGAGNASVGSGQSRTWTNTVSPRCVVAPQARGGTGPARVPWIVWPYVSIHAPIARSRSACSGSIVPSGRGPMLSRRFAPTPAARTRYAISSGTDL